MSRTLNFVFGFGLLGALVMSFVTPFIISVLFTPPVSFGTNCEPAAAWSMSKLHTAELVGVIGGMIGGLVFSIWRKRQTEDAEEGLDKPVTAD